MTDRERKRAFVGVVVIVALAVAALSATNPDRDTGARRTAPPQRDANKIVVPADELGGETVDVSQGEGRPAEGSPGESSAVRSLRLTAAKFARAYLARDRRALQATATDALWETLRQPARDPLGLKPEPGRLVRVAAISEDETSLDGLSATVEYVLGGRRRYLRLEFVNEAGSWRVSQVSP